MYLEKHPGQSRAFHHPEGGIGVITIGDKRSAARQGDLAGLLAQETISDGEMRRVLAAIEPRLQGAHESAIGTDSLFGRDIRVVTDLGEAMEVLPAQSGLRPEF